MVALHRPAWRSSIRVSMASYATINATDSQNKVESISYKAIRRMGPWSHLSGNRENDLSDHLRHRMFTG